MHNMILNDELLLDSTLSKMIFKKFGING